MRCCAALCCRARPQGAAYATALDIADGLEFLHGEKGVVHHDLSASNVLLALDDVDPRGFTAILSDFGERLTGKDKSAHPWPALSVSGGCQGPGGWSVGPAC